MRLGENNDVPWSENWQPTPQILAWWRRVISLFGAKGGHWASPTSGHVYAVNPGTKTLILLQGDPDDPRKWHLRTKRCLAQLGWTVLDSPKDQTDQQAFAEALVECLRESATGIDTTPVTLEYRPFKNDGLWNWFWVLLPEQGTEALETGSETSRAKASVAAREAARKLRAVITKINVLKPYAGNLL